MFEAAELGQKIGKREFEAAVPELRIELLEAQQRLRQANFPVIVVLAGVDKGGKTETVNVLNEWMDPRWLITRAYGPPSDEERERPEFWRFWRDMPPKGKIGLFLSSWYSRPVVDHVHGLIDDAQLSQRLEQIAFFERELALDGALIVKLWMHLGKKAQKKRYHALKEDPLQSWRLAPSDWENLRLYDRFVSAAERTIMRTSTGLAPWHLVEGADPRYRYLTAARHLLDAMNRRFESREASDKAAAAAKQTTSAEAEKVRGDTPPAGAGAIRSAQKTILQSLDMTQAMEKKVYSKALDEQRGRFNQLFRKAKAKGISTIVVMEGWDAAGKGGGVRRMLSALDARDYQVIPIAAPTDEERAQHYLWRFWRHLSRAGRLTIFDRSWYGRLLVERVEGFATEEEWMRAYAEINDFEQQLVRDDIVLVKCWLHITADEQLRRFKEREKTPFKRWKLTDEDWRNREKWGAYEKAVNDMIERTSTIVAPWTLVEANDKRFARVKVISTVCDALQRKLGMRSTVKKPKGRKRAKVKK